MFQKHLKSLLTLSLLLALMAGCGGAPSNGEQSLKDALVSSALTGQTPENDLANPEPNEPRATATVAPSDPSQGGGHGHGIGEHHPNEVGPFGYPSHDFTALFLDNSGVFQEQINVIREGTEPDGMLLYRVYDSIRLPAIFAQTEADLINVAQQLLIQFQVGSGDVSTEITYSFADLEEIALQAPGVIDFTAVLRVPMDPRNIGRSVVMTLMGLSGSVMDVKTIRAVTPVDHQPATTITDHSRI